MNCVSLGVTKKKKRNQRKYKYHIFMRVFGLLAELLQYGKIITTTTKFKLGFLSNTHTFFFIICLTNIVVK